MQQNRIIIATVLSPFLLGTAVSAQQLISGDYTNDNLPTIKFWAPGSNNEKYYYVTQNTELDGSYTFDAQGTPERELFMSVTMAIWINQRKVNWKFREKPRLKRGPHSKSVLLASHMADIIPHQAPLSQTK